MKPQRLDSLRTHDDEVDTLPYGENVTGWTLAKTLPGPGSPSRRAWVSTREIWPRL